MCSGKVETHIIETKDSRGPGNVVLFEMQSEQVTETFTAFGEIGVSSENVAKEAVREGREYLASSAVAGDHLSDQLLLPFALAGGGSFTATKLTQHLLSNMEIIRLFLAVRFEVIANSGHIEIQVHSE